MVENQQSIGQVTATDADGAALTYTITGSEIAIDEQTGVLSFVNTNGADFETKNRYTATVTVSDGTNSRAGTVMTAWIGTNITYADTSTADIGNTGDVDLTTTISGANVLLQVNTTSDNWNVKAVSRLL